MEKIGGHERQPESRTHLQLKCPGNGVGVGWGGVGGMGVSFGRGVWQWRCPEDRRVSLWLSLR